MVAERTMAVIVAYYPERERIGPLLAALREQVDMVLIIDNTPGGADWKTIAGEAISSESIRIHALGENLGIATAQNVGIRMAIQEKFDYLLFSDQDSIPQPGMVENMVAVACERSEAGIAVGSVCPAYYDETSGQAFRFQVQLDGRLFYSTVPAEMADPYIEILTTISSGSLVPCHALGVIGGMRDDYFIDHVDTEWCHRARSHGFRHYCTSRARLVHQLGDSPFKVWYFGWRVHSEYSPTRLYYRFRNFVNMVRLPYVPLRWSIRASWYWAGNLYAHGLFARDRLRNLRAILLGLWDGFRGIGGATRRSL